MSPISASVRQPYVLPAILCVNPEGSTTARCGAAVRLRLYPFGITLSSSFRLPRVFWLVFDPRSGLQCRPTKMTIQDMPSSPQPAPPWLLWTQVGTETLPETSDHR